MPYNMPLQLKWMLNDIMAQRDEERKKKESGQNPLQPDINGAYRNEYTEGERASQTRQDILDEGIRARGAAALESLARNNDAFEVSAGRMDPALFNMKYGGAAPVGQAQSAGKSGAQSGDPAAEYMNQIIAAYKEAPKGVAGEKEDFMAFADRYKSQFPQQAPAMDPFEMRRQRNAMGIGDRVTKDFQDNMRFSASPDGMRFNDRGGPDGMRFNDLDGPATPSQGPAAIRQMPRPKQPVASPASIRPQFQKPTSFSSRAMTPQSIPQVDPIRQPVTLNTPIADILSDLSDRVKKRREAGQQKLRTGIYGNR